MTVSDTGLVDLDAHGFGHVLRPLILISDQCEGSASHAISLTRRGQRVAGNHLHPRGIRAGQPRVPVHGAGRGPPKATTWGIPWFPIPKA